MKSIVIPKGVGVGQSAFRNCSSLKSAVISANIGNYLFTNCTSLKNIVTQEKLISIGAYALYNCYVSNLFLIGSSSDWDNVYIGVGNDRLNHVSIYYYSDTQPTTTGNYWHYDTDGVTPIVW